jgi:predicted DNA-binding WGR domain protein
MKENENALIGTEIYPVSRSLGLKEKVLLRFARRLIPNENMARALEFRLHNNSEDAHSRFFGNERPASAYFTTTAKGELIIEWGKMNSNSEIKLHKFLDEHIDLPTRKAEGSVVRSGHINTLVCKNAGILQKVALIDSLCSGSVVDKEKEEYIMVCTLLTQKIIPVTSDGYPVMVK